MATSIKSTEDLKNSKISEQLLGINRLKIVTITACQDNLDRAVKIKKLNI